MSTTPESPPAAESPTLVRHRPRWSASLIWLVPAVAIVLGLSVALRAWTSTGPHIEVSFRTADGLEAGKTQVRFKNVVIGSVGDIALSDDRSRVIANIKLTKSGQAFATEGSRFWVVRPRIGAGGVTGVDTLLSGAFVAADAGTSQNAQDHFVGLETPPAVIQGEAGREYILRADDLGSLNIGSPLYYRRVQVGRVVGFKLDDNGGGIAITVFVSAPYDQLVTRATRFWNASGLDVSLGANGLKVNTQSLATVLEGGIAFQSPPAARDKTVAAADAVFRLAADEKTALAQPDGEPVYVVMRFKQSMRGLSVDAPVDLAGIEFGHVTSINLDYDDRTKAFTTVVGAVTFPERMGRAYRRLLEASQQQTREGLLAALIERGLRAQARSGNLLTGQLYIAIDFVPKAQHVAFDASRQPMELPTVAGQFDKLQDQLGSIVDKIDHIPFDSIGAKLDRSLGSLDQTLKHVDGDVLPAVKDTLAGANRAIGSADKALGSADKALGSVDGLVNGDSPLRGDLTQTLQELQRSARSLRELTEYLGRHPESLIRGRDGAPQQDNPRAEPAPNKP